MKFHLWWFIMYLSSMCYFNSNHCNGFILGSHLSDVYGSLSDYYFFFLYFTSLFLCAHVYVHMFICVWGGLGSMCIWRPEEGAIGIPGIWRNTWLVVWVLVSKLQSSRLHSVLRHESSLQPPLPMHMESLLRFISSLMSLIFQRLFKIKV